MRIVIQIFILLVLTGHLLLLSFSTFTFVGFGTDLIVPVALIAVLSYSLFKNETISNALRITFGVLTLGISIFYIFIGVGQSNHLGLGTFSFQGTTRMTSFYWIDVDDRIFNAYFQPVGAHSGGEGNFWITESPTYFPVIEEAVYYKHAILWNFGTKEFDGQSVDQNEIVRSYIKDEVIMNRN